MKQIHWIRGWFCILCLTVLLTTACSVTRAHDSQTPPARTPLAQTPSAQTLPAPTRTPFPTPVAGPGVPGTFEPAACPFALPPDEYVQGKNVDCGYLVVPERRDGPEAPSRTIRLAIAIFHPEEGATRADPVIYLAGGPGGSVLETLRYALPPTFKAVLESGRDLVLFDQRGVGRSKPALDCPEIITLARELSDREIAGQPVSREAATDLLVQTFLDCGQTLSQVADLSAYNSVTSASDVADLRRALGYAEVNLWGASYGTRLALEVMRRHPAGIRSVVLDAVYPPDVDLYATAPANFERALDRLFESCAANAVCAETYPDLRDTFFETVTRLNANPLPSTLTDFATGEEIPTVMDGDALIATTFQILYDTEAKLLVPELIFDANRDDLAALENVRSNLISQPTIASQGMMFSVQCHEEVPFGVLTASDAAQSRYPEINGVFAHGLLGGLTARVCAGWDAGQADPSANEPVHSDLPTLIMTGEFDPVTPPAWGERVAQTLPRSHAFEYPGVGHGASFVQGCPQQMFLAFLDNPTGIPDATCIATTQP